MNYFFCSSISRGGRPLGPPLPPPLLTHTHTLKYALLNHIVINVGYSILINSTYVKTHNRYKIRIIKKNLIRQLFLKKTEDAVVKAIIINTQSSNLRSMNFFSVVYICYKMDDIFVVRYFFL